ncbi:MAG TPA: hypothetical protein VKZ63_18310, partial [Kofleriaceae bacterium]|nr:hypothetical protein [Kofleriaceae bacterium]
MTRALAHVIPLALSLGLAAACGDDLGPAGAGGADGGPDPGADGGDPGDPGDLAFAVATDFITPGVATTVTVPGLEVT